MHAKEHEGGLEPRKTPKAGNGTCTWRTANARLAAMAALAALFWGGGSGRARWIEDGVGGAWGSMPAESVREYVPWDDAGRTRATVGALALAATVLDSNTVVVAGAGLEGVDGVYGLSYDDEWSTYFQREGGGPYELYMDKGDPPLHAFLIDTTEWTMLYETWDWPGGAWHVVPDSLGVEPAPVVGYPWVTSTNEVTRVAAMRWEDAYAWGNHAEAGYLTGETDPLAVRLDQSVPQDMAGFPRWRNPEQRVEGLALYNANGNNELVYSWTFGASHASATISFWFRTTATVTEPYTKHVLSIKPYGGGNGPAVIQNGNQGITVQLSNTGGGVTSVSTASAINDNTWRLFTTTWETNLVTLYVNGVPEAYGVCSNTVDIGSSFRVGYYGGTSRSFTGYLDELAVWTNALSAAAVRDLTDYRLGLAETPRFPSDGVVTTNGLVVLHRFEETSGTTSINWVSGQGTAWRFAVNPGVAGMARSAVGTAYNEYLGVEGGLGRPADRPRGVLRVGNPEATTRLTGALAVYELHAAPASATAAGLPGDLRIAAEALYVCVATNSWVKTALAPW